MGEENFMNNLDIHNMPQYFTLIASSKLYSPAPVQGLYRHRLEKIIDENNHTPMIIIHAPSGYGKTMLVSSYLQKKQREALWYHFSDSDKIFGGWMQIISCELYKKLPQDNETAALLKYFFNATKPEEIGVLFAAILNMLPSDDSNPFTLVLEDFHRLENNAEIHQILSIVCEHLNVGHQIMVLSQTMPLIPASPKITILTQRELAFTIEETTDLFKNIYNLNLTPAEISAINTKIEGWGSGLYIINEALHNSNFTDWHTFWSEFVDSSQIYDFLFKKTIDNINAKYKFFLYNTSIFALIDPHIIQHLWPTMDVLGILHDLEHNNLFIYREKPYSDRYRYLNIFRYYLYRHLLKSEGSDYLRVLHHNAAIIYEQHEMIDYAIVHYMASGDYQQVPKLIKELASRNRPDKVLSIIEGRLETLFPEMEGLGGIALRRLIPLEIYESLLSNLLPYVNNDLPNDENINKIYTQQRLGAYYFYKGDGYNAYELLKKSKDAFTVNKMLIQSCYSAILLGMNYVFQGELQSALPYIDEAYIMAYSSNNNHAIANALYAKAQAALSCKKYNDAEQYARQALAVDCWPFVGESFYFESLAMALLLQGYTAEALEAARNALVAAKNSHVLYEIGNSYAILSLVELRNNNIDDAVLHIQLACEHTRNYKYFYTRSLVIAIEIAIYKKNFKDIERFSLEYKNIIAATSNGMDIPFIENVNGTIKNFIMQQKSAVQQQINSYNAPKIFIRALGKFQLSIDGNINDPMSWGRASACKIFLLLLANHNKMIDKEQIKEALWPNEDYTICNNRFHVALHTLRKGLGLYSNWIIYTNGKYSLELPIECEYDVDRYMSLAKQGLLRHDINIIVQAINLYSGDFCENFQDEDYLTDTRRELRKIYLQLLETVSGLYYAKQAYKESLAWYQKFYSVEPFYEKTAIRILEIYYATNELNLAIKFYLNYSKFLLDEIGTIPSKPIRELYKKVLSTKTSC